MAQQFKWTADYQSLLLACLVAHGGEFDWIVPELRSNYFVGVHATIAARSLLDYRKARGRFPSWVTLRELVARETEKLRDDSAESADDFLSGLQAMDTRDWEHVKDDAVAFLRERAYVVALQKAVKHLQDDDVPSGGLAPLFEEASRVGQNLDDMGFLFHSDVDRVIDMVTAASYGVATGYPMFDKIWKNGWGPGWLIVPLAPPKRYKTGMCINLACNMVSPHIAGDVLYYACELSQELAMTRAMCNIANLSTDYLFETPEKFRQSVKAKMQEAVAGNLLFKSFASKAASILDIRAHAKAAVKEFDLNLKAIYIDYAETVKGDESKDAPEYRKSASVYTGARALGAEMGCCVVMPDRCNKETTDKPVPSMTSFQGSFEKAGIVDVAFGLCATDDEYRSNVIRWFNFLNRHGAAYQHLRGRVDPISWRMEFNEEVPFDEGAEQEERRPRRGGSQRSSMPRELVDP